PPDTLNANNGGIVFDAAFDIFRLVADHRFREEGSLPVQVAIASNALPFITTRASGTALANDAPLSLTVLSPNINEAQLSPSPIEVARVLDDNQFADINDFKAYVTSSGGQKELTAANGGIVPGVLGGSTFSVLDYHFFDSNFLEEGDVPFSATVVDSGGRRVS